MGYPHFYTQKQVQRSRRKTFLLELKIERNVHGIMDPLFKKAKNIWNEPGNIKNDRIIARGGIAGLGNLSSITHEVIDDIALRLYCSRQDSKRKSGKMLPESNPQIIETKYASERDDKKIRSDYLNYHNNQQTRMRIRALEAIR